MKRSFQWKGWNLFEIIWLLGFSFLCILNSIFSHESLFALTVSISGIICVVLTAKGSLWSYVFGMYNTVTYAYTCYQNGLFGEVMLNVFFFIPMNIIGWIMWKKYLQGNTVTMRKLSVKGIGIVLILSVVATTAYGFYLSTLKGQNSPYLDALIVVLYIIATYLQVQRYREQWALYIVINTCSIILWLLRLFSGTATDSATMVLMWTAYLVNSIYGFILWSKGAKQKNTDAPLL